MTIWWTVFQDATLDSLIHVAVRQNPFCPYSLNRIDMAKANLRIARGGYYPALSLDAGWNRQQTSAIPVRDSSIQSGVL